MNLKSLRCPNCDADLDIEDGLDTFFCKYCGHKIIVEGQSEAAYEAKVRIKEMEHEERLQDKRNAQERYKIKLENKNNWLIIFIFGGLIIIFFISSFKYIGNVNKEQEQQLQAIIDQIMIDIENENFSAAYIKANSLYWNGGEQTNNKWDAIREEVINQIKEAEEKATGTITRSQEENVDENKDDEKNENDEEKEDILDKILNLFD